MISEKDTPSGDYEKLLYHFKFREHFIENAETLEVLTEVLERFSFDTIRDIQNGSLLKRYEQALREQLLYIQTVNLLKQKEAKAKPKGSTAKL